MLLDTAAASWAIVGPSAGQVQVVYITGPSIIYLFSACFRSHTGLGHLEAPGGTDPLVPAVFSRILNLGCQ